MLGAGLQFKGSRNGEDWFYSAARARLSQEFLRRAQSDITSNRSRCHSDKAQREKSKPEIPPSRPVSESSLVCNLERFLESVMPSVPVQYLSKTKARTWRISDGDPLPFFLLGDLWESFKEWSAYGVGVPLVLNDHDGVIQYYVPYLSAIQVYADLSKSTEKLRRLGEESDGENFKDSSSDGSSDSEQERGILNCSGVPLNCGRKSVISPRLDHLSLREQQLVFQEGLSSDESDSGSSRRCLLFEYFERDQPYCREPLASKISDLAVHFPELKSLRSCDLLPSSWISVAWYPIYRIPTGSTLRDLDACFLTYHSLHKPLTGGTHSPAVVCPTEGGVMQVSLPVFGLASYKYKAQVWTPDSKNHQQLASGLRHDVDRWLTTLQVNHPDYSFFRHRQIL